jgi:hypothetical protein
MFLKFSLRIAHRHYVCNSDLQNFKHNVGTILIAYLRTNCHTPTTNYPVFTLLRQKDKDSTSTSATSLICILQKCFNKI